MSTILYITAHPLNEKFSYSLSVGQRFVEAYREANPNDEVVHLDLYKMDVPQLDGDVFGAWGKLSEGIQFDQLSGSEQAKVGRLGELVDQFMAADKYVFVNPVWNYGFPPVLKAYIDAICVAGKTFTYESGVGPIGLLTDKKAAHIQASGSVLSNGVFESREMSDRHLDVVMKLLGVPLIETVFVEGMAASSGQAHEIKENAIQQAVRLAERF